MIILIFKMLLAMLRFRRVLFWWGFCWLIYNLCTLNSSMDVFDMLARIFGFVMCVFFMWRDFYDELLFVRSQKFKGPRW